MDSSIREGVARCARVVALGIALVLPFGCEHAGNGGGGGDDAPRSFYLGFTPWPYRSDADFSEVFYTYDLIQDHGDIVAHHFQQGIPYPEAYAMRTDPDATGLPGYDAGGDNSLVFGEIDLRAGQTDEVSRVYLAVDSLDTSRSDLIGYYGVDYDGDESTEQQQRPDNSGDPAAITGYENTIDWSSLTFADQEIADAFVSYARAMIDTLTDAGLSVAYFNYASEVSDLLLNDPAEYSDFLIFASRVYGQLKSVYPSLPLMVSVALKHPAGAEASTIISGAGTLMNYVDVLGISVYPYAFFDPAVSDNSGERTNGLTDLPSDWATQIGELAGTKPVAFTETGWIAEDLSIAGYGLTRYSSETNQLAFVEKLFAEANALDAEFIVWFALVDYSYYWTNTLAEDEISAIWRDTGLLDYDGTTDLNEGFDFAAIAATPIGEAGLSARSALTLWDDWLSRPRE